jgi:hypothetical protein
LVESSWIVNNLQNALITWRNSPFGKSIVLSRSRKAAVSTALTSVPKFTSKEESLAIWLSDFVGIVGALVVFVLEKSTKSACWRVPRMITHAPSRVEPRAIPKFNSALRQSRFRVLRAVALSSTDAFLSLSGWLTRLSTLNKPLALLNILEPGKGGVGGGACVEFAVRTFGGTEALPNVVRKASRGVERRKSPAT